jgi:hypothetical protein
MLRTRLHISLPILLVLAACSSTPGKMDEKQLASLRADAAAITPGTSRDKALGALKGARTDRLSSTLIEGVAIEEWKVEAFHEGGAGRDLFVTFLYFADGVLVDESDRRIDYRANDALLTRWTAAAKR